MEMVRITGRISWAVLLFVSGFNLARGNTILVQPVIVGGASDSTVNDVLFADAIFSQIGATVDLLPEIVSNTLPNNMIDLGATDNLSTFLTDGTWHSSPLLTVWYVTTIDGAGSGVRGVSFEMNGKFGIGIADVHVNDTFSHEIGHILTNFGALWQPDSSDPSHSTDPTNLLASGSIRDIPTSTTLVYPNGLGYDHIQAVQIAAMTSSPFDITSDIPEPVTFVQAGFGLVLVILARRRGAILFGGKTKLSRLRKGHSATDSHG